MRSTLMSFRKHGKPIVAKSKPRIQSGRTTNTLGLSDRSQRLNTQRADKAYRRRGYFCGLPNVEYRALMHTAGSSANCRSAASVIAVVLFALWLAIGSFAQDPRNIQPLGYVTDVAGVISGDSK